MGVVAYGFFKHVAFIINISPHPCCVRLLLPQSKNGRGKIIKIFFAERINFSTFVREKLPHNFPLLGERPRWLLPTAGEGK